MGGMQVGFEKGMAKGIAKGMAQAQAMAKGGMGCGPACGMPGKGSMGAGYMNGMGHCGGMHNMQRMGGVECLWGETGAGTSNWAMPSIAGVAPPDMVSSRSAYEMNPAITDAPVAAASAGTAVARTAIAHTAAIGAPPMVP